MDFVRYSAKAIAAALVVLLVAGLRIYWPELAQTEVQEALRLLLEVLIGVVVVWCVPNGARGASKADGKENEK